MRMSGKGLINKNFEQTLSSVGYLPGPAGEVPAPSRTEPNSPAANGAKKE